MKRLLLPLLAAGLLALTSCADARAEDKPVVVIETSMGNIKVELNAERAPITVKNFLEYVDDKHYDNTIFHRVIDGFMIQGGGFKPGLADASNEQDVVSRQKKTRAPIRNEARNGLSNVEGTIAMARTNNPDSATAQFYINVADNSGKLDPSGGSAGYAVFGKVIDGMDVVKKIKGVRTKAILGGAMRDVPAEDVLIKSIRRADK
jgi:cyclophilin family peptidyl-prolyl cis-trans isomerase